MGYGDYPQKGHPVATFVWHRGGGFGSRGNLVPGVGIEPTLPFGKGILSRIDWCPQLEECSQVRTQLLVQLHALASDYLM